MVQNMEKFMYKCLLENRKITLAFSKKTCYYISHKIKKTKNKDNTNKKSL